MFIQTHAFVTTPLTETYNYGDVYFTNDAFTGCEKVEVVGSLPQPLECVTENRYVIGPVVDRGFWRRERAAMHVDRGPCELNCI
jgi:hypothetical protein